MKITLILFMAIVGAGCAPVKSQSRQINGTSRVNEVGGAAGASAEGAGQVNNQGAANSGISAVSLSGRQVDLYAIRAGNAQVFLPPAFDTLPCGYFRQGQEFEIPPVPGGPPIALRGPIQNFYSGSWIRETEYLFKLSVYKRIYRDPGIPDWLPNPPTARVQEYVLKLFDVSVSSPTSQNCRISARPLN